jgi:hypothetical protein
MRKYMLGLVSEQIVAMEVPTGDVAVVQLVGSSKRRFGDLDVTRDILASKQAVAGSSPVRRSIYTDSRFNHGAILRKICPVLSAPWGLPDSGYKEILGLSRA